MLRSEVGYAGGRTTNPTYHNLADHAEAVELVYDATQLTFDELLGLFWAGHDPTVAYRGSQYRSALFCHNDTQYAAALASAEREGNRRGKPIHTEVALGKPFYAAEAYHQKWRLRRHPELLADLQRHYPDEPALLASTAAAKLNAYLGGGGTAAQIARDIDRLGLSPTRRKQLETLCHT